VLGGHPRFFRPEARTAPGGTGRGSDWGWPDAVQLLIERGHSLGDVRGYTLAQLRAFTAAAEKSRRRELRDQVVNLRAAQYEKNDFAKYLKGLDK
jgi:hypothetical protein